MAEGFGVLCGTGKAGFVFGVEKPANTAFVNKLAVLLSKKKERTVSQRKFNKVREKRKTLTVTSNTCTV